LLRNKIISKIFDFISLPFFEKIIIQNNVRIMHAHFGTFGCKLGTLKKRTGIPLLVTFYGIDISYYIRQPEWIIKYRKMFEFADKFIVLCDEAKQRLINCDCPEKKIEIWDIGINLNEFPYKERKNKHKVKFLTVARFREKKGYPILLKAFSILTKKYRNVYLTIIGYGPLKKDIGLQIKELGIDDQVTLIDTANIKGEDFNKLFKNALYDNDIFVLPSIVAKSGDDEGGPPVVITNAQSSGMPVISTPVGGISRAIIDNETGILAAPGNPYSLFEKMEYLINHQELWRILGEKARKHIEKNFNLMKQVQKLEEIYNSLL